VKNGNIVSGVGAMIFFTLPTLILSLLTLDLVFWVGENASLPTQITIDVERDFFQ